MYAPWPELFDYAILAPTLLRLVAGAFFLMLAFRMVVRLRMAPNAHTAVRATGSMFAALQGFVGIALVLGAYVQLAALAGIILTLFTQHTGVGGGRSISDRHVQYLLMVICLALMVLGAGLFSLDLPL